MENGDEVWSSIFWGRYKINSLTAISFRFGKN